MYRDIGLEEEELDEMPAADYTDHVTLMMLSALSESFLEWYHT